MAKPNIFTLDAALNTRLSTDLVSTYAAGVWAWRIPPGSMPGLTSKPVVGFETRFFREPTDANDGGRMEIDIVVIGHIDAAPADMETVAGRVLSQLHRWQPTVTGIGTSVLYEVEQARGEWDESHVAFVLSYETFLSEG